jgi:hypothetical protein
MIRHALLVFAFPPLAVVALGTSMPVDSTWANHQQCISMLGSGPEFRPQAASSILVTFPSPGDGIVSVVVFELGDEHLGGKRRPGSEGKEVICTPDNAQRQLCEPTQLGEFLISDEALQKASHTMITRAVDLSKPTAIQYPVTGPGYYCVAMVPYSSPSFSATMTAVDPGTHVPAFRNGLLGLYRVLAPVWMLLCLAWALFSAESTSIAFSLDHPVPWILLSSAGHVAARWAWLEAGDETWGVALRVSWYVLAMAQDSIVIFSVHMMAARGSARYRTRVVPTLLVGFVILYTVAAWADVRSTAESRLPSHLVVLLGVYLGSSFCLAVFRLCQHMTSSRQDRKPAVALCAALAVASLLFGCITLFNGWALVRGGKGSQFGSIWWRRRFLFMDMPFELLFLLLAAVVVVHLHYADGPRVETEDVAGEEVVGFVDFSNDTR